MPDATEAYLREAWPVITKALKEVGIRCELNLVSILLTSSPLYSYNAVVILTQHTACRWRGQ